MKVAIFAVQYKVKFNEYPATLNKEFREGFRNEFFNKLIFQARSEKVNLAVLPGGFFRSDYPDKIVDGRNPKIQIKNTNTRDGYPHPYVASDGTPCFGGHERDYAKYLASGDVEKLGIFLHAFLTQPRGGGYKTPDKWNEVK